jgi:Ran GTPase-activating protein (RanGAP) involved in mRNA processing and transport
LFDNTIVTTLDITGNFIGPEAGEWIGEMLKRNKTLGKLTLTRNALGTGIQAIAAGLTDNRALKTLIVSGKLISPARILMEDNKLGDRDAMALANLLKSNSTLLQLDLRHNAIGDLGAAVWGQLLSTNETLMELHFGNNNLRPKGTSAILNGAKVRYLLKG